MHRRSGKTILAVNELIKRICSHHLPNPRGAYLAPYGTQAKRVAWDYLKQFSEVIPGARPNESELRIDYPNGGRIWMGGSDNPDSLRGPYYDFVVLDEVAQMAPRAWTEVLRPALSDRKGGAIFIGTPMGKANRFFQFFQNAAGRDQWVRVLLTVDDTHCLDPEELEEARQDMSEDEYLQEFHCSWEAAVKGAYYGRELGEARRQGRVTAVPWNPHYPVYTAWDLGFSDATAIWFSQVVHNELHIIDFEEWMMVSMIDIIDQVRNEKNYSYARHFAPHDIKHTEYTHGQTRYKVAQKHGIHFQVTKNIPIVDGIEAGKVMMRRAYIDEESCHDGLMALEQYRAEWDDKRQAFRKLPLHDWTSHAADAWRYKALNFDHMLRPTIAGGKPKVLRGMTR